MSKKKIIYISLPIFVAISFFIDILIKKNLMPFLIFVSDSFADSIFTTLSTVAALGSGLQSIIIGTLDKKTYGFTLKDVLKIIKKSYNFNTILTLNLASIILAIILLSLNLVNTLTCLTIAVIVSTIYSSCFIWKIITDSSYVKKQISFYIKNEHYEKSELNDIITTLLLELRNTLEINDDNSANEVINLLKQALNKGNQKKILKNRSIEGYFKNIFSTACFKIGFVNAYKKILCFNDNNNPLLNSAEIALEYINTISFSPESNIYQYNIPATIDDIIENLEAESFLKIRYSYNYFFAVFENNIINKLTKDVFIKEIIEKLSIIYDNENGKIKKDLLLYIFKDFVLENENINERLDLFSVIIEKISDNISDRNEYYVAFISEVFRAIYFYAFYENDTLQNEYQKELLTLFLYSRQNKNKGNYNLCLLILNNGRKITEWLCNDALNSREHIDKFDRFPSKRFFVKQINWTQANLIIFAFIFYLAFSFLRTRTFPLYDIIKSHNIDTKTGIFICKIITQVYDIEDVKNNNFLLKQNIQQQVQNMQKCLNCKQQIPQSLINSNFDKFNSLLKELIQQTISHNTKSNNLNIKKIKAEIINKFNEDDKFKFNKKLSLKNTVPITMSPSFTKKISYETNDIIPLINKDDIEHCIDEIVRDVLPVVTINFGISGINILKENLKKGKYKYRNYDYINDLGIKQEVKQTEDFYDLRKLLNNIKLDKTHAIHDYIFLKTENIEFNFEIVDLRLTEPSDADCNEFINSHKIADGKYRIDGMLFNYTDAVKYVQSAYRLEHSAIKLVTNIDKNGGFKVNFDYT